MSIHTTINSDGCTGFTIESIVAAARQLVT